MKKNHKKKSNAKDAKPLFVPLPNDTTDRPISKAYKVIDNDLARDNLENNIPESDLPY